MLKVVSIEQSELTQYMTLGFQDDIELFDRYHHFRGDLSACVQATMRNINECAALMPLHFYKLESDGEPIGYSVTGPSILYSFAINIKYRTKGIVLQWWEHMKALLHNDFRVVLYNINKRAIDFFIKNGMEKIHQDKEYTILII